MKPEADVREHAELWLAYAQHLEPTIPALDRGRAAGYLLALKDVLADDSFTRRALPVISRLCSSPPLPTACQSEYILDQPGMP